MKYIISLFFLQIWFVHTQAQADLEFIADPIFDPLVDSNCINCVGYGGPDYMTGTKVGIGYGIAKEVKPDIDLLAMIGYSFWQYEVQFKDIYGSIFDRYIENAHLITLSLGGRVHLLRGETSSLYVGMNVTGQFNPEPFQRRFGLSVEPNLGWCRSIGGNHEFFAQVGYDQHISSYNHIYQRQPGKVSVAVGFNLKIGDENALHEE